ncbi:hypothetical protein LMP57_13530, partial [Staphylococcus aureus]|nr:hypothetical protein [Staphylococcus aureus]
MRNGGAGVVWIGGVKVNEGQFPKGPEVDGVVSSSNSLTISDMDRSSSKPSTSTALVAALPVVLWF